MCLGLVEGNVCVIAIKNCHVDNFRGTIQKKKEYEKRFVVQNLFVNLRSLHLN
jgi:hypothetical protein